MGFAAPRVPGRHRAGAGPLAAQSRRAVSERRQRLAQHGHSVHRSAVLRAASVDRDSRRPTCSRSAPIGAARRSALNPRLTGLRTIFNAGRLAIIQRTGYDNSSRSHFQGTDIWSTAIQSSPQGTGWLGRYLDLLPAPVDPLTAWSTVRETPRTLLARTVGVPSIPSVSGYAFASPNGGSDATAAQGVSDADRLAPAGRQAAPRIRELHGAGGLRDARPRRPGQHVRFDRHLPEQRPRAGAARRRRRDEQRRRHEGVLGPDGRLRHSRRPEPEPGQRDLHHVDGDAERCAAGVLQRSAEPGTARATPSCCNSPSSGDASPRTRATAPTTAPRA